ncbi:glycoside hydrolase family 43 protein [Isoptericola haloaureus]|uniref:Glycoside hydrolase family 43 protein n=1 Tax=Isoptericola haloaureus TaxID=1542902 RepID=A0ABU7Z7H2_9MICO
MRSRHALVASTVAALVLSAAVVPAGHAADGVPTTDDPPTYTRYGAIDDPGRTAPDYFQPLWYDTDGRHVQAHGGQVVTVEENGQTVHYWYGEDRSNGYWDSPGVAVYRSTDTLNWTNEGIALRSVVTASELEDPYFDDLYNTVADDGTVDTARVDELDYYLNSAQASDYTAIFERPKVLYNAQNDTWVMWWHADGQTSVGGSTYSRSMAAVAVSDSPTGPFRMTGSFRLYNRADYQACTGSAVPGQARDMTVFQEDDGSAYIVYSSEENHTLYIARLNADYTNVEHTTTQDTVGIQYSEDGQYPYLFADGSPQAPVRGDDFQIVKECGHLEAPAVFEHGGTYYTVASGATGWAPNSQTYYSADDLFGTWIRGVEADDPAENISYDAIPEGGDGRLSVGDGRGTTFGSQSTDVLSLGGGRHVYLGDRWNNGAADSTYVWLPITVGEGGRLEMRNPADEDPTAWGSGWDATYWDDQGAGEEIWTVVDDGLPETVLRGADPAAVLPATVSVQAGTTTSDVAVTWDADLDLLGRQTVTGTLAAGDGFGAGRRFTRELTVWEHGTVNLARDATVSASSRTGLAATTVDGDTRSKGWDDWSSSGYPLDSWLELTWDGPQEPDEVVLHTYADGAGATWPSRVDLQYRDASGSWTDAGVGADVVQDPAAGAPVVQLDAAGIPATTGLRVLLHTDTSTWQSVAEVEVWGTLGDVDVCSAAGTTVSASFHQTRYETMPAQRACDDDGATAWSTWDGGTTHDPVTFTVDAGSPFGADEIVFTNTEGTLADVSVDHRAADGTWQPTTAQDVAPAANGAVTTVGFDAVTTDALRLTFSTPGSYLKISELSVPAQAPVDLCTLTGTQVAASFHQTRYEVMPAQQACDGDTGTAWSTWDGGSSPDEATYEVLPETAVSVDELSFTNTEGTIASVDVAARGTDGLWTTVATGVAPAANGQPTAVTIDPTVATGFRLTFATPGSYLKVSEVTVSGLPAAPPGA